MRTNKLIKQTSFIFLLLSFSAVMLSCDGDGEKERTNGHSEEMAWQDTDQYLEMIKSLYEKAKESGKQVPDDLWEWVNEDIRQIGAWQYRIIELPDIKDSEIEKRLNELGNKRWECFWVEKAKSGKKFYMKKRSRSYLQSATKAIP